MRSIVLLLCLIPGLVLADEARFADAEDAYAAADYERAAGILEALVETDPACAACAHLLGRAYGRLAEQAGWTRALGLAKKTRVAFETAVDLDPRIPMHSRT